MYILEKIIIRLRDGNCYGCQNDIPGQHDHMQGGCLCEWEETVNNRLLFKSGFINNWILGSV